MLPKYILAAFCGIIVLILGAVAFFRPQSFEVLGINTVVTTKNTYTIAVYGDSLVDTMGENMDYLAASLKKRYPNKQFKLYNYGIGSQNIQTGVERFDSAFNYQTRHYPPITELKPDIIIVGSFGYNPFSPHNRDRHWQTLTLLVNKAKATGAQVYMLAEIAPIKNGFGKGVNGVNWSNEVAGPHVEHIIEQLQNAVYLARDHLKVPLIDAYTPSSVDGKYGKAWLINRDDGIHPSVDGHQLMAEIIASTIKLK